jgi:hypothetical protein
MFKRVVWKRYWENNRGEIIIQRERRIWWTLWAFWTWEDHELLDNKVYSIERSLNRKVEEIKDLLQRLESAKSQLETERKEISQDTYAMRGFSDPFREKCKFFFGNPLFSSAPSGDWRGALGPKLTNSFNRKKGIKASAQEKARDRASFTGPPQRHESSERIGVVPEKFKASMPGEGFDKIEGYSPPQNQSKNSSGDKNRKKGESDQGPRQGR